MATAPNMRFSLVFEAVTAAFNEAVNKAATTFTGATADISKSSAELERNTRTVGANLQEIFKTPNAAATTAAIAKVTAELNAMGRGAVISADDLKRVGEQGKAAATTLTAELTKAREAVQQLSAAKAAPADIDEARQRVIGLRQALDAAETGYKQFEAAAVAAMNRATRETAEAEAQAKSAGTAIYAALDVKPGGSLRQEIAQITQQLQQFRAHAGAPADEVERVTRAAEARIASLRAELGGISAPAQAATAQLRAFVGQFLLLTGAPAAAYAVAAGLKAILDTASQFTAVNKQLEYAVGGVERAGEEFEFVRKTAKDLGIDLMGSAEAFAQLAAATKGTQAEGQVTRDVFLGIAQGAATLGLSVDNTKGILLALSQIASKGKVSMEELRGQLGERLTPAFNIAAKAMGVTTADLEEMVETGLDATEFLTAFGPALQEAFAADAAKNVKTLTGQTNLLRNEFKELLNDLGNSGLTEGATALFRRLTGLIGDLRTALKDTDPATVTALENAFKQLAQTAESTFIATYQSVAEVISVIDSLFDLVVSTVQSFAGFRQTGEDVSFLVRVLQGVSVILGTIQDGVGAIRIAFRAFAGVAQSNLADIAEGLSKITFGDLSKGFAEQAERMRASARSAFADVERSALGFQSAAVAAMDRAATAAESSAERSSKAHTSGAATAASAQEGVARAAREAGAGVETAAGSAAAAVASIGGAMAPVAQQITDKSKVSTEALATLGQAMGPVAAEFVAKSAQASAALASVGTSAQASVSAVQIAFKRAADDFAQLTKQAVAQQEVRNAELAVTRQIVNIYATETESRKAAAAAAAAQVEVALKVASARQAEADLARGLVLTLEAEKAKRGELSKQRQEDLDKARQVLEAKQAEADKSRALAEAKTVEAAATAATARASEDNSKRVGEYGAAVDAAKAKVEALTAAHRAGAATETEVRAARTELATATRLYRDALSDATAAAELHVGAVSRTNQMATAQVSLANDVAQAQLAVARATGDSTQIQDAQARATQVQVTAAMQHAAGLRAEADAIRAAAAARELELRATGALTKEKQAEIEAQRTSADLKSVEAQRAEVLAERTLALAEADIARTTSLEAQTAAQEKQIAAAEKAAEQARRLAKVDKEGFSTDKNNQRIVMGSEVSTRMGMENFLRQAGVKTEEGIRKIVTEFTDALGNVQYFNNPGQIKYGGMQGATMTQALLNAAQRQIEYERSPRSEAPRYIPERDGPRRPGEQGALTPTQQAQHNQMVLAQRNTSLEAAKAQLEVARAAGNALRAQHLQADVLAQEINLRRANAEALRLESEAIQDATQARAREYRSSGEELTPQQRDELASGLTSSFLKTEQARQAEIEANKLRTLSELARTPSTIPSTAAATTAPVAGRYIIEFRDPTGNTQQATVGSLDAAANIVDILRRAGASAISRPGG